MKNVQLVLDPVTQSVSIDNENPTVPVLWNRAVRDAVVQYKGGPTIAARAYGMLGTAMFDAWASYDEIAIATQQGDTFQRPAAEHTDPNKAEAISYAAYRILINLFPAQHSIFDQLMSNLGYDPNNESTDVTTPAGIGNVSAQALIDYRYDDNSNQDYSYLDTTDYRPVNLDPENVVSIDRWTPEYREGDEPASGLQSFLTPHWGEVTPFESETFQVKTPEPFLLVDGEVNLSDKTVTLADGFEYSITKNLIGTVINPKFIEQAETVIQASAQLTDRQKLIAEFWEDRGGTPFPPGTWLAFGEYVSARDKHSLDDDVKLFFKLGNAVFDAGVKTWKVKYETDYVRPVRAIRELGRLGLVGTFDAQSSQYVIEAYDAHTQSTQTISTDDFITYQSPNDEFSPPFAEYVSGHSSFSAAAAQVLREFTGNDQFGASVLFQPGQSRFEPGTTPDDATKLKWRTFTHSADEAGLSRRFGGIHFIDGDIQGRVLGRRVGQSVIEKANSYIYADQDLTEGQEIRGTRRDDILIGTSHGDRIIGLKGADILAGGGGSDGIFGQAGDDVLYGDSGQDTLKGGAGQDELWGGDDADLFVLDRRTLNSDIIADFQDGIDQLTVVGVKNFSRIQVAQSGQDTLIQSARNGQLFARLQGIDASLITSADFQ